MIQILDRQDKPSRFEHILGGTKQAMGSIADLVGSYKQKQAKAAFGKKLATEFGKPELESLIGLIPPEKYGDLYKSLLKESGDRKFMESLIGGDRQQEGAPSTEQEGAQATTSPFEDMSEEDLVQIASLPEKQRDALLSATQPSSLKNTPPGKAASPSKAQGNLLSPQQEMALALTHPSQFNAYKAWKEGAVAAGAKEASKERLQSVWNDMSATLKKGKLGLIPYSKLTEQGREDRSYFDTLGVELEGIGKEMVSKGILSQARFNYLLKNIPASGNTDASNRGKLKAWAKILDLDPASLGGQEGKSSSLPKLTKVASGTPLTAEAMRSIRQRTGDDMEATKKMARQLGYEVP